MGRLTDPEIQEQLGRINGWALAGDAIVKEFTFAGFPEAVAFVSRLVPDAEASDHHPDVTINYRRVTVAFSTHSEGGLTMRDFTGAAAVDRCA